MDIDEIKSKIRDGKSLNKDAVIEVFNYARKWTIFPTTKFLMKHFKLNHATAYKVIQMLKEFHNLKKKCKFCDWYCLYHKR